MGCGEGIRRCVSVYMVLILTEWREFAKESEWTIGGDSVGGLL